MRSRLILAALLAATGALLAPAPAFAVGGLELKSAQSAFDSVSEKSATASCDAGSSVLGGGGFIEGGGNQVHFNRLQALGNSDDFVATAVEHGTVNGNWRVHAYAICGNAPAGLEYISYQTLSNSNSPKSAGISCSGSKQLISTGARILNGDGQVIIDELWPSPNLTTVTSTGYEDETGYAGNWSIYAYGVCANPLPGLELKSVTSAPVDSSDDAIGVACNGAKKVHGLGAMIDGGQGEVVYGGIYPSADLTTGVVVAIEEGNGQASNWWSRIYIICAT
jgi:hypothetical protein